MSKDRKPERELWLVMLGLSLANAESRDAVLGSIPPEDFPDADLAEIAQALKGKDTAALKTSLEGFGVRVNGKVLDSIVDRGVWLVRNRRIAHEMARLEAASKCESSIDQEKFLVDTIARLNRLLATKGAAQ